MPGKYQWRLNHLSAFGSFCSSVYVFKIKNLFSKSQTKYLCECVLSWRNCITPAMFDCGITFKDVSCPTGHFFRVFFLPHSWVSGIQLIFDPRIWNLCIRFMMSELLTPEVRSIKGNSSSSAPRDSMLLLFYGISTGPPTCYDVRFSQVTQSDDSGQLFYASTPVSFKFS